MTFAVGFVAAPWAGLLTLEHAGPTALACEMAGLGLIAAGIFSRIAPAPVTTDAAHDALATSD